MTTQDDFNLGSRARACRGVELDPHYVDVILTRWEEWTNRKAVLR